MDGPPRPPPKASEEACRHDDAATSVAPPAAEGGSADKADIPKLEDELEDEIARAPEEDAPAGVRDEPAAEGGSSSQATAHEGDHGQPHDADSDAAEIVDY